MEKLKGLKLDLAKVVLLKAINLTLKLLNSVVIVMVIGIGGRGEFFKLTQIGGIIAFFLCLSLGDYFLYNVKNRLENIKIYFIYSFFLFLLLFFPFLIFNNLGYLTLSYFILFTLSGGLEYLTLSLLKSQRKYNSVSLFISIKIISFLIIFYSLKLGFDAAIITYFLCSIVTNTIFMFIVFDIKILKNVKIDFKSIKNYSKNIHLNNIFTDLENKSDIIIITIFLGNDVIGIYSLVVVLAQIINHITHILIQTIAPIFKSISTKEIVLLFNFLLLTSVVFSSTLFISQKFVLSFLYNLTEPIAYKTLSILCLAVIPETLTRLILTFYKYGEGSKKFVSRIALITALMNISLNILLVPFLGIVGAATVSLITYLTRFFLIFNNLKTYIKPEKITIYNPIKTIKKTFLILKSDKDS
tara:strand:+ start:16803 stop:18044 length:1242 start_codon:yes stop_codon:yes gene_type:complete